jgi:hypothetical protein
MKRYQNDDNVIVQPQYEDDLIVASAASRTWLGALQIMMMMI